MGERGIYQSMLRVSLICLDSEGKEGFIARISSTTALRDLLWV